MLLTTAVLLVFAIARLLGDGSDASSDGGGPAAKLAAQVSSTSGSTSAGPTSTGSSSTGESQSPLPSLEAPPSSTAPVLAAPVGACVGSDVAVEPVVEQAVAGRDVMVVLQVRTIDAEACTWQVSPDSLTVSITSGSDRIWNSRDCARAVPTRAVVVRKAVTTEVGVVWKQTRRSDESCSRRAGWALPGWYHVTAAALGGEPSDLQFELATPTAVTVTKTATPKQQPTQTQSPTGAVD
jgi:hypothetical protein